MRGLGEEMGSLVLPRGGAGDVIRNGPNPMIGCRVQQTCGGRAEETVEAGRNGKDGTSTRLASSGRRVGDHPGVDARFLSRWRGIFGKPQERSSNLIGLGRTAASSDAGSLEAGRRRAACEGERRLCVSEGEPKVRRAAYHWYTDSRVPLDDHVVTQDPGSLGRAGKANYSQPVSR
jgi:hypothetical protein